MAEKYEEIVTVLSQRSLGNDIYDLVLQTKDIAGAAKAGQFVSVYSNDKSKLLPRPISLCGIDREKGTLRLVYRVTGQGTGTEEFSRLKEGDTVKLLGPLGNGFTVESGEKSLPDWRWNRCASYASACKGDESCRREPTGCYGL